MDLDAYLIALSARDGHPHADVRALTDNAVLAAIDRHRSTHTRPTKGKPAGYRDPTGDKATARASRRQKRKGRR